MIPTQSLLTVKRLMICVLTLSVFIMGFYLLSVSSFRGKDSYLTILDKGLFETQSSNGDAPFTVSKIIEFRAPFTMMDADLLDMNTLAFTNSNPKVKNSVQTGIYDISKNTLNTEFDQQNQVMESHTSVSNDGKMILASYKTKKDGLSKTIVYEVNTNRKLSLSNGVFAAEWLSDSTRFVGMDDFLFIQDIKTGKREDLLKISDVFGAIPESFLELKVLKDGQTASIMYNTVGIINVLKVDLNTGDHVKQTLSGQFFYASPIHNKAIALVARINNQEGLYLYDVSNHSIELLIDLTNKKLFDISISEDGKRIAYSLLNAKSGGYGTEGTEGTEVHAAYLDHNQIQSNEVVYKELNHLIDKLIWTKDSQMLYCFQRNTKDTTILRILFKTY